MLVSKHLNMQEPPKCLGLCQTMVLPYIYLHVANTSEQSVNCYYKAP